MVAGKLFTAPMRPGEGVSSSLLVGSERCRGLAGSWAKRGARETASRKINLGRSFKIPPEKSEELVAPAWAKEKVRNSAGRRAGSMRLSSRAKLDRFLPVIKLRTSGASLRRTSRGRLSPRGHC